MPFYADLDLHRPYIGPQNSHQKCYSRFDLLMKNLYRFILHHKYNIWFEAVRHVPLGCVVLKL